MKKSRLTVVFGLVLVSLLEVTAAWGQSFKIDWWAIGGGGGTSTNNLFTLSGTVAQPDTALSGGEFSLQGGFWSFAAVVQLPDAPILSIAQAGPNVNLSWPSLSAGFALESTPFMKGTNSTWTPVSHSPSDNGVTKSVTIPLSPGNQFFRLKHP